MRIRGKCLSRDLPDVTNGKMPEPVARLLTPTIAKA
jgi:hypothetical protein